MIDLRQGDCLELMKDIPDKSIDMILCDLPYGTTACKWDTVIPFEPLWEQYNRIIKDNGAIVLFGSEPFSSKLRMSNLKMYKYDWVWVKSRNSNPSLAKSQPLRHCENVIIFGNKKVKYYPQMIEGEEYKTRKGAGGRFAGNKVNKHEQKIEKRNQRYPKNVIEFKSCYPNKIVHPTQKPVALLEYLIKTYTNEGETVLDNCAGSMSTVIASINTNRNCIAIEKDKNYFEIGKKRVIEHLKTNNIFANLVIFDNECAI